MRMNAHSTYNIDGLMVGVVAVSAFTPAVITFGAEIFS
jgi:hypothetical protein